MLGFLFFMLNIFDICCWCIKMQLFDSYWSSNLAIFCYYSVIYPQVLLIFSIISHQLHNIRILLLLSNPCPTPPPFVSFLQWLGLCTLVSVVMREGNWLCHACRVLYHVALRLQISSSFLGSLALAMLASLLCAKYTRHTSTSRP